MAQSLSEILGGAWENLQTSTLATLEGTIKQGVNSGLAALAATASGPSDTPPGSESLWDKVKASLANGVKASDLGSAASFSSVISNPLVLLALVVGAALLFRRLTRRK